MILVWLILTPLAQITVLQLLKWASPKLIEWQGLPQNTLIVGLNDQGILLADNLKEDYYQRINVLGFFDLAEFGGSAYEDSVNAGMMDLVAALRWVHENIANFGGDPNKVMIYGQSGGGSKVTTLLGMPAASGLMHRASVQSGGGGNIPDAAQTREFTRQVIKELGVSKGDMAALQ